MEIYPFVERFYFLLSNITKKHHDDLQVLYWSIGALCFESPFQCGGYISNFFDDLNDQFTAIFKLTANSAKEGALTQNSECTLFLLKFLCVQDIFSQYIDQNKLNKNTEDYINNPPPFKSLRPGFLRIPACWCEGAVPQAMLISSCLLLTQLACSWVSRRQSSRRLLRN